MTLISSDWLERQKQKSREEDVKRWTEKFRDADGKNDEWQKVYVAYLASDVWAEKRKQVLTRADGRCEDCKASLVHDSYLDVHHENYDRVGGRETMSDLKALCSACHEKADKKRERQTFGRRNDAFFQRRLDGFGKTKYGAGWAYEQDEGKVELEFVMFLYKKFQKDEGLPFNPSFDPETDLDFLEFWDDVLDGNY